MSYTKIAHADPQPDAPEAAYSVQLTTGEWIAADEIGVELDTGERVAVSSTVAQRDYATQQVTLLNTGRLLTADGGTAIDEGREPVHIATQWTHVGSPEQIALVGGLDLLRRECLLATLGESPTLVEWPARMLAQVSIRAAIATAALLGEAIDNPDPL